jgi:hypothetical protein
MAKIQEDINAENAHTVQEHARIAEERQCLDEEAHYLNRRQAESELVHRRRHQSRLPANLEPTQLVTTPPTPMNPGAGVIPTGELPLR